MKSVKTVILACAAITMIGAGAVWAGNQNFQSRAAFCSDNGSSMLLAGKGQGNGNGKQHRKGNGNGSKDGSGNGGSGPKDGTGNGNKSGTCVNS